MKLKICGVRSVAEAQQLILADIDYIGLNFIPVSTRRLDLNGAKEIMAVIKKADVKTVALFADQSISLINTYADVLNIDYVQLHGKEKAKFAAQVNRPLMRAIAVSSEILASEIINYIAGYPAEYYVLDRFQQGKGQPVNVKIAEEVIKAYPGKIFLAGGLTPENLTEILSNIKPYGIDIAGGVRTNNDLDLKKVNDSRAIISSN